MRCSHPPCMNMSVSNGQKFDGSSPASTAISGSVYLTGINANCTSTALISPFGSVHSQRNTAVLIAMRDNTTTGLVARGAVSINGNTNPPAQSVRPRPIDGQDVGISESQFHVKGELVTPPSCNVRGYDRMDSAAETPPRRDRRKD